MILTPIDHSALFRISDDFAQALASDPLALKVFRRVTALVPDSDLLSLSTDPGHHAQGVELCRRFGFGIIDERPQDYFTWDGEAVAIRMEPSVLIHEVAHYQCAAPARRTVVDFGLGAGPESGRKAEGEAAQTLFCPERDVEEGLCSLLGILWEADLGQPAVLAFLEQNWLEGGTSLHNVGHFRKIVRWLRAMDLIDDDGRPTMGLREEGDDTFFARWFADS
ncbi:Protein conserved in bacteria [Candidatus Terasakiella magnetica]|nr:Protein conserved in bacteria [Candidatus Terasakiella magnetica]